MTDQLRQAAQAVLDRWDSPAWEWVMHGPTADLMAALRTALEQLDQSNFCPRCGKRTKDIHTCTPPQEMNK